MLKIFRRPISCLITIKISKQEVNKGMEKSFKNQIQKFNNIINPAILHLSNFILSDAQNKILNPIFLTEYMPKGSLKNFLELKEKQTQIILNDTKKYFHWNSSWNEEYPR